jgi:hypothetical protein
MIGLGPLAFAAPWALVALIALPALWMLLRATPPAPRTVVFAPIRLLQRLARTPETPQTTPWWLIVLRLFMAALIILALAQPVWRPDTSANTDAPLLVVVDDGWAAAHDWPQIQAAVRGRLEGARADGRQAALVFTATDPRFAETPRFTNAGTALAGIDAHQPQSWAPDRTAAASRVADALIQPGAPSTVDGLWFSDGVAGEGDTDLSRAINAAGSLRLILPEEASLPLALTQLEASTDGFVATIKRPAAAGARTLSVTAYANDGRAVARADGAFEPDATELALEARLPLDLRNRITRIEIDGASSAGAVHLTGDRWRRPRVGVLSPEGGRDGQPLLSDLHYVREALGPSAELVIGELEEVLATEPAALILVDSAPVGAPELREFVDGGGLIIRFAGQRLAANRDDLLPTPLREGGRLFGGALAWDEPQGLSEFADDSPFAGLAIPAEADVNRQVLAEPGPALDDRVWARLDDGTPLVTAARRGEGWLVLFHVTASPDWSSLPLSGLFPAMLDRTLALADSGRAPAPSGGAWTLDQYLTGRGALTAAPATAEPVPSEAFARATPGPATPPGLWTLGASGAALNAVGPDNALEPISRNLPGAVIEARGATLDLRFAGPLLATALLLLALDVLIALMLSGRLPQLKRAAPVIALTLGLVGLGTGELHAQTPLEIDSALEVRLAYVATGDASIDRMSEAGLFGVARESTRRSAVEPGAPARVDIEQDEILFYPLLYWPITMDAPELSDAAAAKVSAYLQSGGLIVFDTRDGGGFSLRGAPHPGLARTLDAIDIPPLQRVPADHVIGRTFYLLDDYPGRYPGGEVWVEADDQGSARDGVSGVVIGSADWAAAWAMDENGRPLGPVEGGEFQRELAIRFGVNLAMYALTGNYKADQVHVPAILERLGQD